MFIFSSVFSYQWYQLEYAEFLWEKGIIVQHIDDKKKYRLEESITRQEMVGIAIKVEGTNLPNSYPCYGYFQDVRFWPSHEDSWVCRAVEVGADLDIVSRDNAKFRPRDLLTRIEALAMLVKSAGLEYPRGLSVTARWQSVLDVYGNTPQWQIDLIEASIQSGVISIGNSLNPVGAFGPNTPATRAEVFEYAYRIMNLQELDAGNSSQEESVITGTIRSNSNNTTTYISPSREFQVTYPKKSENIHFYPLIENHVINWFDALVWIFDMVGLYEKDTSTAIMVTRGITTELEEYWITQIWNANIEDSITDIWNGIYYFSSSESENGPMIGYMKIIEYWEYTYTAMVMTDELVITEYSKNMYISILNSFRLN